MFGFVTSFRVYKWHGWATLRKTPAVDDDDLDQETWSAVLDQETLSAVGALLAESDSVINETADLRGANGKWHVWLAGCHNHRTPDIEELFRSTARAAPGSYGILYTFDDEASDGWDRWVMRRGSVCRAQDEDLSPHAGAVEDREQSDQED